jgi:hypothetical protein
MTRQPVVCDRCGETRYTEEPCITCHGSKNPGKQTCSTCFSYRDGRCHRIEAEVAGWWNGCMLHCPEKLRMEPSK